MLTILLLAARGAAADAPPLVPRVVLQVDHATVANVASASADRQIIVTASSGDNSVLIRDAATGNIIDRFRLPYNNNHFPAFDRLTVSPDMRHATIAGWGYAPVDTIPPNTTFEQEETLTVDLRLRRVVATVTGKPLRKPARKTFGPQPLKTHILPNIGTLGYGADARLQLRPAAGAPRIIGHPTARSFAVASVSRDGTRLALLSHKRLAPRRWATTIETLSLGGATAGPAVTLTGFFDRIVWIDADTVLLAYEDMLNAFVYDTVDYDAPGRAALVDLAAGRAVRDIPARCAVVSARGQLIGIGRPGDCRGRDRAAPDTASERGLWQLDPRLDKGTWQRLAVTGLEGLRLERIAAYPDGRRIVVAHDTGNRASAVHVVELDRARVTDQINLVEQASLPNWVGSLAVSSDGRRVVGTGSFLFFSWTPGKRAIDFQREMSTDLLASDGRTLVAGSAGADLSRVDAESGKTLGGLTTDAALAFDFLPGKPVFVGLSQNGGARFWDTRTWTELLTVYSFPDGKFFAVDPAGRYDTNLGADTNELRWVMDDAPLQSLGAQTFMRNLYEPGLLRRTLACVEAGCAAEFPPLPSMADLNRVLPEVAIVEVKQQGGIARVTVEAREGRNANVPNGKRLSGIYDLRLFRDGRLVRQTPNLGVARDEGKTLPAWRAATAVPQAMEHERYRETFEVAVPRSGGKVEFSAYAFNEDRVKGETARRTLVVPPPRTPPRRRLVVVAIGVDRTRNPEWHLSYAANDARSISAALANVPDADVTVIPLISDAGGNRATKPIIRSVLLALGGNEDAYNREEQREAGIDLAKLTPVGPDDAVLIAFSGHGTTLDRQFYLLPWDADEDQVTGAPQLQTMISSVELTAWLRQLDAGEIAFVIDACHSAASVDGGGFKPGPMGDPGLGQLAFDKGIRILAATQANDVALEDGKLGHGLLSYALNEGLEWRADANRDGAVTLGEWLDYGVRRMPGLAAELRAGGVKLARTVAAPRPAGAVVWFDAPDASVTRVQQPALFDFTGTPATMVLRRVTKPVNSLRSR
ncbi:hypothetical protein FMM06_16605 [Glacieibacterium frigidum]|uniref:Peptidase C14 caspase domain-containing protein n=1 Tax=Glacieibacterium frigidum TaxID=2593303 RepID=A0A552UAK8_9SPHN|nr:hypothetical protein FMM06_16605 [Glacieibacterium frigidum]